MLQLYTVLPEPPCTKATSVISIDLLEQSRSRPSPFKQNLGHPSDSQFRSVHVPRAYSGTVLPLASVVLNWQSLLERHACPLKQQKLSVAEESHATSAPDMV